MRYQGLVYRAINPIWAKQPYSGEGARRFGGRFNPQGIAALYTSLSILTALRESQQIGTLQPTTLVAYQADIEPVLDARDLQVLAEYHITAELLGAQDWRQRMKAEKLAPTQRFAVQLIEAGYAGLLVPSFARGTLPQDTNLVLWKWGTEYPNMLILQDSEGRLL